MSCCTAESRSSAPAEFDQYSDHYDAGMGHPLKRMVGKSADDFIAVKVAWLLRAIRRANGSECGQRWLDYGCGIGVFTNGLIQAGCQANLHGCDVSGGMLAEATRRLPAVAPRLRLIEGGKLPYANATFDLIFASAVLHHVAAEERVAFLTEAARVLAPHGRLVIFEHNPWHPVTQWVVRHTPIDRDACLLTPRVTRQLLLNAGFSVVSTSFLMFLPPRWEWARRAERWCHWLPLGGQYAVMAQLRRKTS